MKTKALIMSAYYIPSVKGGGPIQSIKNLVDNLSDEIDFYIITADRDLGDCNSFDNITSDTWIRIGSANVLYTDVSKLSWRKTAKLIKSVNYDVIYLNSFFSYKFSIVPLILRKIKGIPRKAFVLAPRGEFSNGALGLKSFKKRLYIKLSKIFNLYKGVKWHATNEREKNEIQRQIGEDRNITIAKNLTSENSMRQFTKSVVKKRGELKIVYISRIHPMKNLLQSLEIMKDLRGTIEFNIYGPIEDNSYWQECKKLIEKLPNNINVSYNGLISNDKVNGIHKQNHVFLLLTLGENFGHAILEALIGGSPVVISDRTPWRNLENESAGWDLSLCDNRTIANKIEYLVDLDQEEYMIMSKKAFDYGKRISIQDVDINTYISLLNTSIKT